MSDPHSPRRETPEMSEAEAAYRLSTLLTELALAGGLDDPFDKRDQAALARLGYVRAAEPAPSDPLPVIPGEGRLCACGNRGTHVPNVDCDAEPAASAEATGPRVTWTAADWTPTHRPVIVELAPVGDNGRCTGCGATPSRETGSCRCPVRIDAAIRSAGTPSASRGDERRDAVALAPRLSDLRDAICFVERHDHPESPYCQAGRAAAYRIREALIARYQYQAGAAAATPPEPVGGREAAWRGWVDAAWLRMRVGTVIDRWYRAGLLRFNSHDDGSDDLLLRDEIVAALQASPPTGVSDGVALDVALDEYYVARHSNDAVRVDEAIIDVILAASTPTTPGEPAGTLDEAWAEAEAALPEGWVIRGLAHGSPADETEWVAAAGTMPFWETPSQVRGYGSTPNAALRALAVNLDGAFRLRDHEGVAREQADSEPPR